MLRLKHSRGTCHHIVVSRGCHATIDGVGNNVKIPSDSVCTIWIYGCVMSRRLRPSQRTPYGIQPIIDESTATLRCDIWKHSSHCPLSSIESYRPPLSHCCCIMLSSGSNEIALIGTGLVRWRKKNRQQDEKTGRELSYISHMEFSFFIPPPPTKNRVLVLYMS